MEGDKSETALPNDFRFSWKTPNTEEQMQTIDQQTKSISQTILKMKAAFIESIHHYMEEQNLNKEEVALFEEVVSETEDGDDEMRGGKRGRKPIKWQKNQKRKTRYGKRSR